MQGPDAATSRETERQWCTTRRPERLFQTAVPQERPFRCGLRVFLMPVRYHHGGARFSKSPGGRRPSPDAAPVTSATLFSKDIFMKGFLFLGDGLARFAKDDSRVFTDTSFALVLLGTGLLAL